MNLEPIRRHYGLLYPGWIVICVIMFLALRFAPDPSRPEHGFGSAEAGARAVEILLQRDAERYRGYDVVQVAFSPEGEAGDTKRWVVLLDRWPRTGLADAVVVELVPKSGDLIRIRSAVPRPVGEGIRTTPRFRTVD